MDLSDTPSAPAEELQVLILVGLPGSGKSCLANALEQAGKWVRASQDDAPNRRRQEAEAMTRRAIQSGRNAVIDRVGFDRKQRSHFIEIAKQFPNVRCTCLVLECKRETLETRLAARTGHPTLIDIDIAMRVLAQMQREYKPPRPDQPEGYARVYVMLEEEQPEAGVWTEANMEELMRKIEASSWRDEPYVPPPPKPVGPPRRGFARGTGHDGHPQGVAHQHSNRGYTDRGRGHYQHHSSRPAGQELAGSYDNLPPWRRPAQPELGFHPDGMSGQLDVPNRVGGGWNGNAVGPAPAINPNEPWGYSHGFRGGRGGFNGESHQRGRGGGGAPGYTTYQYRPVYGGPWQSPAFPSTAPGPTPQGEMLRSHPSDQPSHNPR